MNNIAAVVGENTRIDLFSKVDDIIKENKYDDVEAIDRWLSLICPKYRALGTTDVLRNRAEILWMDTSSNSSVIARAALASFGSRNEFFLKYDNDAVTEELTTLNKITNLFDISIQQNNYADNNLGRDGIVFGFIDLYTKPLKSKAITERAEARIKRDELLKARDVTLRQLDVLELRLVAALRYLSMEEHSADTRHYRTQDHLLRSAVQETRQEISNQRLADEQKRQVSEKNLMDMLGDLKAKHGDHTRMINTLNNQERAIKAMEEIIDKIPDDDWFTDTVAYNPVTLTFNLTDIQKNIVKSIIPKLNLLLSDVNEGYASATALGEFVSFQSGIKSVLDMAAAGLVTKMMRIRSALVARRTPRRTSPRCEDLNGVDYPECIKCWEVGDFVSDIIANAYRNRGNISVACCEYHYNMVVGMFGDKISKVVYTYTILTKRRWIVDFIDIQ